MHGPPRPGPISFIFRMLSVKILSNINVFSAQTQGLASLEILDPPLRGEKHFNPLLENRR